MTPQPNNNDGWKEWANYVLKTLEELKKTISDNNDLIHKLKLEIRIMQTKMSMRAGLIGALTGMIPSVIALIYIYLKLKAHAVVP